MSSLMIDGCSPTIYDSPLTVTNSSSLILADFAIRNTKGVGLMLRNVETLDIARSIFSDNGLGISDCSLETYQWWYSVNANTTGIDVVNYTVTDSVFNGNIAKDYQRLGGGLHFYISNTQSAVITLKNSKFTGINGCLSSGANVTVDGYSQVANIIVDGSVFKYNYRTDLSDSQTGEELTGGALKIKITASSEKVDSYISASSDVVIKNSVFTNNTALYCAGACILALSSVNHSSLVSNSTFDGNEMSTGQNHSSVGRTSGLCIVPESHKALFGSLTVIVTDNNFTNNVGCDGIALLLWPVIIGSDANCSVSVMNSVFHSNRNAATCQYISTIGLRWDYDTTTTGNMTVTVDNCNVTENDHDGHALMVDIPRSLFNLGHLINVYVEVIRCNFRANSMASLGIFKGPGMQYNVSIQSSNFFDNGRFNHENRSFTAQNELGNIVVVGFSESTVVNITDVSIINNSLTPIYTDNCGLWFSGYNIIENNTALQGGGIHISGTGYAFMSPDTTLIFRNNTANLGGALYSPRTEIQDANSYYFPCTFLSLSNALFYNNNASIAGDNMYGGLLSGCVYFNLSEQDYVDKSKVSHQDNYKDCSNLVNKNHNGSIFSSSSASSVSSDPFGVLQCDTADSQKTFHLSNESVNISGSFYPGQIITLNITTVGYCYGFSPGFLNVTSPDESDDIIENSIQSSLNIDQPCHPFSFKPKVSRTNIAITMNIDVADSALTQTFPLKVLMNVSPCPHGMQLDNTTKACQCEKAVVGFDCDISNVPNLFKKKTKTNNWIGYNNKKNCVNIVHNCPFDYCNTSTGYTFNLDDTTDNQCNYNRVGRLCGQCKRGHSLMLGSNKCESHCSNDYLVLLIVFFIAGIALIFFVIFLNLTVSKGKVSGLLFYVNIVKLNETQLFPYQIPVISQFISWLNLDFGINSCFFSGLDGYWKAWLQFTFPLYVWLVTIGIILYSSKSVRFSRYLPNNIISVLATLILISFTKLLRTATDVFMATTLTCGDHTEVVWSVDGTSYWSARHSILMVFAGIVLVLIAVYTILLLFSQLLQRASNYRACCCLHHIFLRIHPFTDAYSGPFQPNHGYWAGVLVLIRIILTVVFIYTSGSVDYINNYVIVAVEMIVFNVFHSGYYQSKVTYYCEKFFHLNLCAVCLLNAVYSNTQYNTAISVTSVALSLLVFIGIIGWHAYKEVYGKIQRRKKDTQPLMLQDDDDDNDDNLAAQNVNAGHSDYGSYSSSNVRPRDSIIFDSPD